MPMQWQREKRDEPSPNQYEPFRVIVRQDAGCCHCYFAAEKRAPSTHLTPCCDPPPMTRKRLGPSLRHVCASGSHSAATDSIHALPSVAKRCSPHPPSPSAVLTLCVHLPNTPPTNNRCHFHLPLPGDSHTLTGISTNLPSEPRLSVGSWPPQVSASQDAVAPPPWRHHCPWSSPARRQGKGKDRQRIRCQLA